MLIIDDRQFVLTKFDSEAELERVVIENAEYIFGPSPIAISRNRLSEPPMGLTRSQIAMVGLDSRRWYIDEAEVSHHSVWNHIVPQITKQIIAANNPVTKQQLIEIAIDHVRDDENLQDELAERSIELIDIHRILTEILAADPIIVTLIDDVTNNLREWTATFKVGVGLWVVRKYAEFKNLQNVAYEISEEFRSIFESRNMVSNNLDCSIPCFSIRFY